jgi:hypothetical protein
MRGQDITGQGIAQGMRTAQMRDETDRRGQDLVFDASRAANQLAARKSQREQENWQATFDAGRSDAAMTQRGTREKEFAARVEKMFTGPDNKVDAPRAAAFQAGIDRSLARLAADNPKIKSIADLGPEAEQKLVAATTLLQRVREQGSIFNPLQVDKLRTIDPLDLVDLQVDPQTGDRIITRGKDLKDGGSRGFRIPKRFFETEEANFFWPGTPTNRFDQLAMRGNQ